MQTGVLGHGLHSSYLAKLKTANAWALLLETLMLSVLGAEFRLLFLFLFFEAP